MIEWVMEINFYMIFLYDIGRPRFHVTSHLKIEVREFFW